MHHSIEFSRESCIKARGILGKDRTASVVWRNNFAPSNHIGNCTNLYRTIRPASVDDFYEKYVERAIKNPELPIKSRGLSEHELIQLAKDYKSLSESGRNVDIPYETYLNDALCHIIVETWDGQNNEREFARFLNTLGYECSNFEGSVDAKYGLDIKVVRSDGKLSAIQIKPVSFFMSNRPDVQNDRINMCVKYENALADLGLKTYYAIYKTDRDTGETVWSKNGEGFRYRIGELFSYQPSDIYGTFVRRPLTYNFQKLPI